MWKYFTQIKIEYFQDYLKLIQNSIKNDLEKLEVENQTLVDSGAKPIENEYGYFDPFEDLANQAFQIEALEQLMLSSFVIATFIFLEDQINQVCILIQRDRKLIFTHKDIKNTGVSRSIFYLEKILEKKFPADSIVKEEFAIAQLVRNSFTHNDGVVDKNNLQRIQSYILKHPGTLSLNHFSKILITSKYCESLIKLISNISDELEIHIPKTGFYF